METSLVVWVVVVAFVVVVTGVLAACLEAPQPAAARAAGATMATRERYAFTT